MIGKTLGHYQITGQFGKGGMEVFQAKDLKLGRDVAIKVLPEEFARDADCVAWFQRVAKIRSPRMAYRPSVPDTLRVGGPERLPKNCANAGTGHTNIP
jgi:hypothetical protein